MLASAKPILKRNKFASDKLKIGFRNPTRNWENSLKIRFVSNCWFFSLLVGILFVSLLFLIVGSNSVLIIDNSFVSLSSLFLCFELILHFYFQIIQIFFWIFITKLPRAAPVHLQQQNPNNESTFFVHPNEGFYAVTATPKLNGIDLCSVVWERIAN